MRDYQGRGLLAGTRALITGGDSGIGRAVAVAFAKEGADVAIAYLSEIEDEDAAHTAELAAAAGQRCVTIRGDLAVEDNCQRSVEQTVTELGGLDVLGEQRSDPGAGQRPRRAEHRAVGTAVPGQCAQLLLDHPGRAGAPARWRRHHQHLLHPRAAR